MNHFKTLGIVGGMGSYATSQFFEYILNFTEAQKETDHFRILIDNFPQIPNRIQAFNKQGPSPADHISTSINNLAKIGADFVSIPCNAVHYFYHDISEKIKIPWLHMIQMVSLQLKSHYNNPLILGSYITNKAKLYSNYLPDCQYPNATLNNLLDEIITEIKLNKKLTTTQLLRLKKILTKQTGHDSILLACSELTFLTKSELSKDFVFLDSSQLYASAIVNTLKANL
ncbi:MAG TPA: amino acid racemase [Patescibacteria group bacterium]|nr:amino acid racemase [Gammaproteobacteria bacterium]HWA51484.1 amino acid racemase [Patescibacteria group bacterium]